MKDAKADWRDGLHISQRPADQQRGGYASRVSSGYRNESRRGGRGGYGRRGGRGGRGGRGNQNGRYNPQNFYQRKTIGPDNPCHNCGGTDHWSRDCKEPSQHTQRSQYPPRPQPQTQPNQQQAANSIQQNQNQSSLVQAVTAAVTAALAQQAAQQPQSTVNVVDGNVNVQQGNRGTAPLVQNQFIRQPNAQPSAVARMAAIEHEKWGPDEQWGDMEED